MLGMRLVGLHYVRQEGHWCSMPMVYSWFVVVCTWLIVLVNVSALTNVTSVGPVLFFTLTAILSFCHHAINATCLVKASHDPKALGKFFVRLSQMDKYGGLLTPQSWLKRLVLLASVLALVCFSVALPFTLFAMFGTTTLDSMFPTNDINTYKQQLPVKVTFAVCETYFIAMWLLINLFQLSVGIFLHHELRLFKQSLTACTDTSTRTFIGSLEAKREHYYQLMRLVKATDNTLSLRQAAAFGCNIISICLLLYVMLYYPTFIRQQQAAPFCYFWLLVCIDDIVIVCASGILVVAEVLHCVQ
jgi:hypothetical protein